MKNNFVKVGIVGLHLESPQVLGDFEVHGVPLSFNLGYSKSLRALLRGGIDGFNYQRAILKAEHVDELYRNRDVRYMEAAENLIQRLKKYDILIFSTNSPLHPELLADRLANKIKVLGFTDDPHSTYVRGIPYLWAFDAAYYISPGYSPTMGFAELFDRLGYKRVRWLPLAQPIKYPKLTIEQIRNRAVKIAYVGNPTGSKIDRMIELDHAFGHEFALYGRWRLKGYLGYARPFIGEKAFFRRVLPISAEKKKDLYLRTMIGFNMHVSDFPSECGNMRTYETAAYGMMPLCDRAGLNLQVQIFEEKKEAIYYDSIEEAIDLANYYADNQKERTQIAWAAYRRACSDYSWEKVTHDLLTWVVNGAG